jgi:putative nucleotidyltransferase with HDIG domain
LLRAESGSALARQTVEDQLRELGGRMGFDLMMVSAPDGSVLAGVVRSDGQLVPLDRSAIDPKPGRLIAIADRAIELASVPVDQDDENLGYLYVGEYFDLRGFKSSAVLMRFGRVLESTVTGIDARQMANAFAPCPSEGECDMKLAGSHWISAPAHSSALGGGYSVRILQSVDTAARPVLSLLTHVFVAAAGGVILLAVFGSFLSARSIAAPIASVVAQLRRAAQTGELPDFHESPSQIREIRELTQSFNRAAASVREARHSLQSAYVEFVGSLASALDARDRYTAGHSHRVSNLSQAIAMAMGLERADVDRIQVGALLHDIGKIGIADAVLQKPGPLTEEEIAIVRQHPGIGRKILEGVQGFSPYLDAVELHHENHDGTGYPHALKGGEIPIDARIIHVADAYDAMTTDRPYRPGMSHELAMEIIRREAGRQFDPRIAQVFASLPTHHVREGELTVC